MGEEILVGELLVQRGAVSRAAVEEASIAAHAGGSRLLSRLWETGACDERELVAALAARLGVPGVDFSRSIIDLSALELVPRVVAEADQILPLSTEGDRVHLAVDSAVRSEQAIAELRFVSGREVSVYVGVLAALQDAIAGAYDARGRGEAVWRGRSAGPGLPGFEVVTPEPLPGTEPLEVSDVDVTPFEGPATVPAGEAGAEGEVVHSVRVLPGPARVLVVDDEAAIRLLAQRALQHKGYQVDVAADGAEALAKVQANPPDLLLLDAMLPKVHGFEVARKVRSDPRTRAVPIIIMTAVYRGWRFAQDARESYGAADYVEKPFRVDDLLRRIDSVLEASQVRDERGQQEAARLLARGRELLGAGNAQEAAESFEQAVRLDRFSAEAQFLLARALHAMGDVFRAMTALERAVDLRPGLFPALRLLASLYLAKGFRNKAAETLERAVKAAPDDATRQTVRAELLRLL